MALSPKAWCMLMAAESKKDVKIQLLTSEGSYITAYVVQATKESISLKNAKISFTSGLMTNVLVNLFIIDPGCIIGVGTHDQSLLKTMEESENV